MDGVNSINGVAIHLLVESGGTTPLENTRLMTDAAETVPDGSGLATLKTSYSFREQENRVSEKAHVRSKRFVVMRSSWN
jgi:hypothetical protein